MRAVLWIASLCVAVVATFAVAPVVLGLLDIKLPFQSERIDRSGPALLKSVQEVSRYNAAVGNFEVVVDVEDDVSYVPDFIAGERSLFIAAGTVDAYVDFSGLSEGDLTLSEDGTSVTIRLPDAELEEPNLDQERTRLFTQERGVVDRLEDALSMQDQSELYIAAEQKIAAAAEESELTAQAEENAKAMLVGMFEAVDLEVTFTDEVAAE